ncbi:hypothetical protein GCM10022206_45110 [Streptomyces chiangmaiensis]
MFTNARCDRKHPVQANKSGRATLLNGLQLAAVCVEAALGPLGTELVAPMLPLQR